MGSESKHGGRSTERIVPVSTSGDGYRPVLSRRLCPEWIRQAIDGHWRVGKRSRNGPRLRWKGIRLGRNWCRLRIERRNYSADSRRQVAGSMRRTED